MIGQGVPRNLVAGKSSWRLFSPGLWDLMMSEKRYAICQLLPCSWKVVFAFVLPDLSRLMNSEIFILSICRDVTSYLVAGGSCCRFVFTSLIGPVISEISQAVTCYPVAGWRCKHVFLLSLSCLMVWEIRQAIWQGVTSYLVVGGSYWRLFSPGNSGRMI